MIHGYILSISLAVGRDIKLKLRSLREGDRNVFCILQYLFFPPVYKGFCRKLASIFLSFCT